MAPSNLLFRGSRAGLGYPLSARNQAVAAPSFPDNFQMQFDGVDERISCGNDASLQITTNLTVSAWVNGAAQGDKGIVSKHDSGSNNRAWFMASHFSVSDKPYIQLDADGTGANVKRYRSSITAFDSTVHHIAFTFAPNDPQIYVDGVRDTSVTKELDGTVNALYNTPQEVLIGALLVGGSASGFSFNGLINDVAIFNATLTETDISNIYNGGTKNDLRNHAKAANLVAYWLMGDGDGDTISQINDVSGNGNHGTPLNMESGDIVST